MVFRTGTEMAPWTLISAEDKYTARLQVLSKVIEQLKQALNEQVTEKVMNKSKSPYA
jgi:polyphosphate kinase 2 (PPK2 family)